MDIPNTIRTIVTRELLKQNKERGRRFQDYVDEKNPKDCKEATIGCGIANGVFRMHACKTNRQ